MTSCAPRLSRTGTHDRRLGAVCALLATIALASAVAAQNAYSIRRIAPLPSHFGGQATAIDNDRLIAGTSGTVTGYATLHGKTGALKDEAGGLSTMAFGVGPAGQLLGSARSASGWLGGAIWTDDGKGYRLTVLPPAPGDAFASARAMSANGTIAGISDDGLLQKAAVWRPGSDGGAAARLLPLLPGDFEGAALGIGPDDTIVGWSGSFGLVRAVCWRRSGSTWTVADQAGLGGGTLADDVNAGGTACGSAFAPASGWHMVTWSSQSATVEDLGQLAGRDTFATALNSAGDVVGYASLPIGRTAVARFKDLGDTDEVLDLNDLIPPGGPWRRLWAANDINDRGDIVGYGEIDGYLHSFVMTPIDLQLTMAAGSGAGSNNTWSVSGATPGSAVWFVFDVRSGEVLVPGCTTSIDLGAINTLGVAIADAAGVAALSRHVADGFAGTGFLFQAFEPTSCKISDVRKVGL